MGLYSESALDVIVDPAIAGNSGTGTLADPYGDLEYAIATLTDPGTGGIVFWIKSGTPEYLTQSLSVSLVAAGVTSAGAHPMQFRGFGTTPWDMVRAEIDLDATGPVVSAGPLYYQFWDLYIHNSGTSAVLNGAAGTNAYRCELANTSGTGNDGNVVYTTGTCAYMGCYFHTYTGNNIMYAGQQFLAFNYFECDTKAGVVLQQGSTAYRNITTADGLAATAYCWNINNCSTAIHNSMGGDGATTGYGIQSQWARINNTMHYNVADGFQWGVGTLGSGDVTLVEANSIYSSGGTGWRTGTVTSTEQAPDFWFPTSDISDPAADGFNEILGASPFTNRATLDYYPVDTGDIKEDSTLPWEPLVGLPATNLHRPWRGAVEPKGDGTSSGNVIYAWPGALEPAFDATCVMTGTLAVGADENDVVSGGATTILTLSDATWAAAGTGPIGSTANTQAIIDGITARTTPTTGWNNIVRDTESTASVVRTSDTVCTITWTAAPTYDIGIVEFIDIVIPAAAISTANAVNVGWFQIAEAIPLQCTVSVTYAGGVIPSDSILFYETGSHITTANSATLKVTGTPWTTNEWAGFKVINITDNNSEGVVISNTTSEITATLTGGTDADWDIGDTYQIVSNIANTDVIWYEPGAVVASAQYDFDFVIIDQTDGDISDTATATITAGGAIDGLGSVSLSVVGVPTFTYGGGMADVIKKVIATQA